MLEVHVPQGLEVQILSSAPNYMAEDQLFYVGQKAFIDKGGKILVLKDPYVGLDLPGGKVQEGEEDYNESLRREIREETGLEVKIGLPVDKIVFNLRSTHKNAGKKVYLVVFKCKYIGGDVKLSSDHIEYKWVGKYNFKTVKDESPVFELLERYFMGA